MELACHIWCSYLIGLWCLNCKFWCKIFILCYGYGLEVVKFCHWALSIWLFLSTHCVKTLYVQLINPVLLNFWFSLELLVFWITSHLWGFQSCVLLQNVCVNCKFVTSCVVHTLCKVYILCNILLFIALVCLV